MKEYPAKRLIRDGDLVAEVEIRLRDDEEPWGPTMSKDDAYLLDDVREAMRRKDYAHVMKKAKLYKLDLVEQPEALRTDAA